MFDVYFLIKRFEINIKIKLELMPREIKNKKYHYFYKITNNLNNHFYYGIHSTNDLDDGYMGSGTRLNYAYKKYGIENFTKEILEFFNSREECAKYEFEMVTEELIYSKECYNIILGGEKHTTLGTAAYIDKEGNIMQLPVNDEKVLNGDVVRVCKGYVCVRDMEGNIFQVSINDERYLSGELVPNTKGHLTVKDKNNKYYYVSVDDERYKRGELVPATRGKICLKDKNNKYYYVSVDDERYKRGELVPIWKNRKHKEETKEKMKNVFKKNKHQQGEKNSQYGTCWITKEGVNKKIKKEEINLYLQEGWIKGRKIKNTM